METQEGTGQTLFIKRLVASIECANCGARYEMGNIHVIGHRGDLWITAVECSQCGTQGLIFAMVKEEGTVEGVISDASAEELLKFDMLPSIDIDEVLDMHLFLERYHGDLDSLLDASDLH